MTLNLMTEQPGYNPGQHSGSQTRGNSAITFSVYYIYIGFTLLFTKKCQLMTVNDNREREVKNFKKIDGIIIEWPLGVDSRK